MSRAIVKYAQVPKGSNREIHSRHLVGLPVEISGSQRVRTELPLAERLVVVQETGGFLLYRFTQTGAFAGDTWHLSLDDVYHQGQLEYGLQPKNWVDEEPENWNEMLAQIGWTEKAE